MKNKKKYRKTLEKRLEKLEAIIKPNSIKLTAPNDVNHTVIIEVNGNGCLETYHNRTTTETQKEVITQETNL